MSIKNFIRETFRACLDILRDSEHLIGDKALRPLGYFLQLRLLESQFGKQIDIDNPIYYDFREYEFADNKELCDKHLAELLRLARFSYLAKVKEDNLKTFMEYLWNDILSVHPDTKDVFLKGGSFQLKKQSTYKKIIDKLAAVDFENIDEDILGETYEEVMKDVMTGKTLGQFFTPPIIKRMMIDLIDPQLYPDGTTESIFDPAMGTGGFLITCVRSLINKSRAAKIPLNWEHITRNRVISGRECEPDTFQLAVSNMLISSGKMFHLEHGDSIRDPIAAKYDIIIANPPFGIKGLEYDEIRHPLKQQYIPIRSKSSTSLFIQAIICMLKINGRCAVVLPDGQDLFSKSKSLLVVREYLMKTCDLKEVIYLPPGMFTHTTIKTCVFYFYKRKEGNEVLDVKIKHSDGKETDRSYVFTEGHQTEKVVFSEFDGTNKRILVEVGIANIAKNNYSLNFAEYLETKIGGGVSDGALRYSDSDDGTLRDKIVVKTLGEICKDVSSTKSIASSQRVSGDYKFFTCSPEVKTHNEFFHEGSYIIQGGRGTIIGSTHVTKVNEKFAIGTSMMMSKVIDGNGVLTKYVFYYLKLNPELFKKHITGTAIPMISKANYYNICIPIPPLEKQQEIVDRLDFVMEHCNAMSRLKIKDLVRLNEFCFQTPVVFGSHVKTLGEVCKFDIGGTPSRSVNEYYQNGTNLWVSVSELNGGYINDSKEKITDAGVQNSSVKLFPKDTVLFSFKLSIGKTAIVGTPLYTNEAIAGIFSKTPETLSNQYLYHYLSNHDFTKLGSGLLGNGSLNKKSLAEIKIPIPFFEEQQEIVEFCETNNVLIKQLEKEIEQNEQFAQKFIRTSAMTEEESKKRKR
jgi:type I restriction-modification system DNA methylase subunit